MTIDNIFINNPVLRYGFNNHIKQKKPLFTAAFFRIGRREWITPGIHALRPKGQGDIEHHPVQICSCKFVEPAVLLTHTRFFLSTSSCNLKLIYIFDNIQRNW